jgi:hypothetical protein
VSPEVTSTTVRVVCRGCGYRQEVVVTYSAAQFLAAGSLLELLPPLACPRCGDLELPRGHSARDEDDGFDADIAAMLSGVWTKSAVPPGSPPSNRQRRRRPPAGAFEVHAFPRRSQ